MSDSTAAATPLTGRTAWARNLEEPLRSFLRTETGSAAILLAATVAALIWVNVDAGSYNQSVWTTVLSIRIGGAGISQTLQQWVNNGLMTFFFLVVGLEARREFDLGELRDRRRLLCPRRPRSAGWCPDGYLPGLQRRSSLGHGWGTAMSTDTAFALGMLALVGRRFPQSLRAFILTVAVVDDLVAFVVIVDGLHAASIQALALLVGVAVLALSRLVRLRPGPQRDRLPRARRGRVGRAAASPASTR